MKIIKILYQIILIAMLIIMFSGCISYATNPGANGEEYRAIRIASITGDPEKGLPDIDDSFEPDVQLGSAESIVEKILGVFTVLGVIAIVICIGLIGFNIILGTASQKAVNQEKLVGLLVAAAVLTGGSSIAQIIMKFAESI